MLCAESGGSRRTPIKGTSASPIYVSNHNLSLLHLLPTEWPHREAAMLNKKHLQRSQLLLEHCSVANVGLGVAINSLHTSSERPRLSFAGVPFQVHRSNSALRLKARHTLFMATSIIPTWQLSSPFYRFALAPLAARSPIRVGQSTRYRANSLLGS
jgi:hypothetical protein